MNIDFFKGSLYDYKNFNIYFYFFNSQNNNYRNNCKSNFKRNPKKIVINFVEKIINPLKNLNKK